MITGQLKRNELTCKQCFVDGHLPEVGDDDVLVVRRGRKRLEVIPLESRVPVRGEQSLVLRHTEWLALFAS